MLNSKASSAQTKRLPPSVAANNLAGMAPAIRSLRAAGFGDTKSREIVRSEILPTFAVGRVIYARLSDLASLPDRLAEVDSSAALRAVRYPRRSQDAAPIDQVDDAVASRIARIASRVREGGDT